MPSRHPQGIVYGSLWVLALALGWFEGAVVVYLRALYYPQGFGFPLAVMSARLLGVEIVREACSILLLAAAASLASVQLAGRIGAFLLLFGVWDLTYYGVLKLVLGWPDSLGTWDLLFLIPLPWVGPVWAPVTVAALFVVGGTYLLSTVDRVRRYAGRDVAVLLASATALVGSFMTPWRVMLDQGVPETFSAWLFWAGLSIGAWWFIHVERNASRAGPAQSMP
jgi:hypothetical protein